MRVFSRFNFKRQAMIVALLGALSIYGCATEPGDSGVQGSQGGGTVDGTATQPSTDSGKLHFDSGISNLYQKNYDGAIEEFEKSLKYNPHSPSTLNNIGFAWFDKGDMDKAIEYHARALEADSEFPNAYYGLALALESKGNVDGAIKNWQEFLSRTEPGSKWAQKAETHIEVLKNGPEKAPAKEPEKAPGN
ncbi:MAG: tetratricopeptide repeat protein [Proteobacteria bacterium]|nr:tetratricopeptide repeat protein [Pseudomonadota bacterium]